MLRIYSVASVSSRPPLISPNHKYLRGLRHTFFTRPNRPFITFFAPRLSNYNFPSPSPKKVAGVSSLIICYVLYVFHVHGFRGVWEGFPFAFEALSRRIYQRKHAEQGLGRLNVFASEISEGG